MQAILGGSTVIIVLGLLLLISRVKLFFAPFLLNWHGSSFARPVGDSDETEG